MTPQEALAELQAATGRRLGGREVPASVGDATHVVEQRREIRVVRPVELLEDGHRASIAGLALVEATYIFEGHAKVVEDVGDLWRP